MPSTGTHSPSRQLLQLPRVREHCVRDLATRKQSRKLKNGFFFRERMDPGMCMAVGHRLLDAEMLIGLCCDLRQMRDQDDLVKLCNLPELF